MEHSYIGGVHRFHFEEQGIKVRVSHIARTRAYTMGNLLVEADRTDFSGRLYYGAFRLNDDRDKQNTINRCAERSFGAGVNRDTMEYIIENVCFEVDNHAKGGKQEVLLLTKDYDSVDDYLLYPLVLAGNQPTMVYANGGSLKTYLAGMVGFRVAERGTPVIILDWETAEEEWGKRMQRIYNGFGGNKEHAPIIYREMSGRLGDDAERIHELIGKYDAGFIIVDSVFGAVGGDLNDAGPAMAMFDALRQFGVPSLLIHHTNKTGEHYGNVYYHNYVRLQWDASAERKTDPSQYTLTLTAKKANNGPLLRPMSFDVAFNIEDPRRYTKGDSITFKRQESPQPGSKAFTSMSPQERIKSLLSHGSLEWEELATQVGGDPSIITNAAQALVDAKQITRLPDGKWGLVA